MRDSFQRSSGPQWYLEGLCRVLTVWSLKLLVDCAPCLDENIHESLSCGTSMPNTEKSVANISSCSTTHTSKRFALHSQFNKEKEVELWEVP